MPADRGLLTHELIHALQARLEQADWQIAQLRQSLYGPTSERVAQSELSPEQVLLSLFPAPDPPPATQDILQQATSQPPSPAPPACTPRQPALRELETVTERIKPTETICPHCGQAKCHIGCERTERFGYIPAKINRALVAKRIEPKELGLAGALQIARVDRCIGARAELTHTWLVCSRDARTWSEREWLRRE